MEYNGAVCCNSVTSPFITYLRIRSSGSFGSVGLSSGILVRVVGASPRMNPGRGVIGGDRGRNVFGTLSLNTI